MSPTTDFLFPDVIHLTTLDYLNTIPEDTPLSSEAFKVIFNWWFTANPNDQWRNIVEVTEEKEVKLGRDNDLAYSFSLAGESTTLLRTKDGVTTDELWHKQKLLKALTQLFIEYNNPYTLALSLRLPNVINDAVKNIVGKNLTYELLSSVNIGDFALTLEGHYEGGQEKILFEVLSPFGFIPLFRIEPYPNLLCFAERYRTLLPRTMEWCFMRKLQEFINRAEIRREQALSIFVPKE